MEGQDYEVEKEQCVWDKKIRDESWISSFIRILPLIYEANELVQKGHFSSNSE